MEEKFKPGGTVECFDISERAYRVAEFSELKNYALIDLGALARNFAEVRRLAGDRRVICVVKADAYGHGTVRCVRKLAECGADFFAVSSIEEAHEVKIAAPEASVLIFGYVPAEAVARAVGDGMILTVYDRASAERILSALPEGMIARVHFKLNTGMNRLGFPTDPESLPETVEVIRRLAAAPGLEAEGVYTHFAAADNPESRLHKTQCERFSAALSALERVGILLESHAAASSGILRGTDKSFGGLRAGLVLWGLPPYDEPLPTGFSPVMSLWSRVAELSEIGAGESVSYGGSFVADRPMKVATMSLGYADGLIRASAGASLSIDGVDCPILGRICMDQFMLDVTELDISVGDFLPIFDSEGVNLSRLAAAAGTINYELVSGVGLRVPRIYNE